MRFNLHYQRDYGEGKIVNRSADALDVNLAGVFEVIGGAVFTICLLLGALWMALICGGCVSGGGSGDSAREQRLQSPVPPARPAATLPPPAPE